MIELKKPKFYIDRSGEFGDIKVVANNQRRNAKGRATYTTELFYRGNLLLSCGTEYSHLELLPTGAPEEVDILNEAFIQIDAFRGLLVIVQDDKQYIIIDGQKVPLICGMEILMYSGEYMVSIPWRKP